MSLLDSLYRSGQLRTLDHALAASLRRLDPDTHDEVLLAAALASLAVSQGDAGFDPAQPQRLLQGDIAWPPAQAWLQHLQGSRWVATPEDPGQPAQDAPLVLENGLLYLRRYREYERQLATGLQRIGRHPLPEPPLQSLAPLFSLLFPQAQASVDHQARAAATTLRHPLALVTGGPGTGKTTTIARLLLLLVAQAAQQGMRPPRVALAAPTGRAAERMAESLRLALQRLQAQGVDPALCEALPSAGTTLHRLLGVIADSPQFRHNAGNPLQYEVIVVDEASMIDLPLMAKLVDAIAEGTRLILLGDPDQLPSVEAGDVLSAILRASGDGEGTRNDDAHVLHGLLAAESLQPAAPPRSFAGRRVQLLQGYRQSGSLQLAPLAAAVREGDSSTALQLLRSGTLAGIEFHEDESDPLRAQRESLLAHWRMLADSADPAVALQQAGRLRILTALREGPQGARGLNSRIEALLAGAHSGYFQGRLLLITENSYRHRLFNGDIGICLRDGEGAMLAWFPGDSPEAPRAFHPAALPAHESAFAMTVHKAQGSEFDEVWLQLPRQDSRVLSRELIYTGLTRARHRLHVAVGEEVLRTALARHASRIGGLAWRLGAEPTVPEVTAVAAQPTVQGSLF